MNEPIWLTRRDFLAAHEISLSYYRGLDGIRDETMLESAIYKPQNLFNYGSPTLYELAASYSYGIVMNHPFVDGNKRTGFFIGAGFLEINGYEFSATEFEVAAHTFALAAGELSEVENAMWFEINLSKM